MPTGAPSVPERLLTTPAEERAGQPLLCTGNDFVSLPALREHDGALERLGVLHQASATLLELVGGAAEAGALPAALLAPLLELAGAPQPLGGALRWELLQHNVPRFGCTLAGGTLELTGTLFAPPEHKGFVYSLRCRNLGREPQPVLLGVQGQWAETLQTVFTSARCAAWHRVYGDRWTAGPVFEARAGTALVGWAVMASAPLTERAWGAAGGPRRAEQLVSPGQPLHVRLGRQALLSPGAELALDLFVGLNREGDGARTCAVDLARHGAAALLQRTLGWLERRSVSLPRLAGARRVALERVANRNLHFCRQFAFGRFIDSEQLCCLTSRSPRYYVSAAFWARDSLLWALPALTLADAPLARQVLRCAFARHLDNAGVHAHYIDGTVLYPGFELDQLCAYLVALGQVADVSEPRALLAEPLLCRGVDRLLRQLLRHRHTEQWLFATFLNPSDDPAQQPYLTYDNALVVHVLERVARWQGQGLLPANLGDGLDCAAAARRVRRAIAEHLVVQGPRGPQYAWSTDLARPPQTTIYDEPPGSLQLLPHYGLCPSDDPVYRRTVAWIRSAQNPYWYGEGALPEAGCPHAEHPFVMSLFNSLLSGREQQAAEILERAPLDNGLACEAFDEQTGELRTGAAFATCAGFLAYALVQAFG